MRVVVGASPFPKRTKIQKVVHGQPKADKISPLWLSIQWGVRAALEETVAHKWLNAVRWSVYLAAWCYIVMQEQADLSSAWASLVGTPSGEKNKVTLHTDLTHCTRGTSPGSFFPAKQAGKAGPLWSARIYCSLCVSFIVQDELAEWSCSSSCLRSRI